MRVPRLQGTVQEQGIPNARFSAAASPAAFGGVLENEQFVKQATNTLGLAAQAQQSANDSAVKEFEINALKKKNELLYDPKTGAMNTQGKDAFNVTQVYGDQYTKYLDELENSLSNSEQKAMARGIKTKFYDDLNTNLNKHTSQQIQVFEKDQTNAAVTAYRDDAIANYQNPGAVSTAIQAQKSYLLDFAQKNGLSPERSAVMMAEAESGTLYGVTSRMLANGQDLAAQNYYKENKDKFTGLDQSKIESALKEGSIRGESQRKSDAILGRQLTMSESLDEARKIQDPQVRDETTRRIKERFSEKSEAEKQDYSKILDNSYRLADAAKSMDAIPPEALARLKPQDKAEIRKFISGNVVTDQETYYDLMTMASTPSLQQEFLKEDLNKYRSKLDSKDWQKMVSIQSKVRLKDGATENQLATFKTDATIVEDTMLSLGISKKKNAKDYVRARTYVLNQIDEYRKLNNTKYIPSDEAQRIIDNALAPVVTDKGWLWDSTKEAALVDPTEVQAVDVEDIPAAELTRIKEGFAAAKRPYSDEAAVKLYLQKLKGSK